MTTKTELRKDLTLRGKVITNAELKITGLYDWVGGEANGLFIDLLDNPKYSGVRSTTDNPFDSTISDFFATASGSDKTWTLMTPLDEWSDTDGPATKTLYDYSFSSAEIAVLQTYLTDDRASATAPDFGIGFDPDCHYYDCGVKLYITTDCRRVPEGGATLALLGLALAVIPALKRLLRA